MKPALLIIDMQKDFLKKDNKSVYTEAVEYINAAIQLFRAKGLTIVCIQHMNEREKLLPGTEGFDVLDDLNILPADIHIHKTYGNAFNKTLLQSQLQELKVDTLILTGYQAEGCVLSTYRGAKDLDLTPIILRGSLASETPEHVKFVEAINDIISYGALKKVLG
ncbi:MAG TPA: cysteine hydrolase [Longilinea sp.]|nr:cysteine hydrolase [Longilinea sp.]